MFFLNGSLVLLLLFGTFTTVRIAELQNDAENSTLKSIETEVFLKVKHEHAFHQLS